MVPGEVLDSAASLEKVDSAGMPGGWLEELRDEKPSVHRLGERPSHGFAPFYDMRAALLLKCGNVSWNLNGRGRARQGLSQVVSPRRRIGVDFQQRNQSPNLSLQLRPRARKLLVSSP